MKIEKQVCTLQQAKILKELGAPQETFFSWYGGFDGSEIEPHVDLTDQRNYDVGVNGYYGHPDNMYAAYTVAELGAMLDKNISCISFDGFRYTYSFINKHLPIEKQYIAQPAFHFDTEAQARAALLIYLLRENIVLDSIVAHHFKR